MKRAFRFTSRVGVVSLLSVAACGDARHPVSSAKSVASPEPGQLVVSLKGASAGGVLLILRGPVASQPTAIGVDAKLFTRAVDSTGTAFRVAIVGDRVTGELFSFGVPDVNSAEIYSVTLVQIADQANGLLDSFEGYTVSIQPKKE